MGMRKKHDPQPTELEVNFKKRNKTQHKLENIDLISELCWESFMASLLIFVIFPLKWIYFTDFARHFVLPP